MQRRNAIERRRRHRARPGLLALEQRLVLSTFTVTNTLDDGSTGSLRWAVDQANSNVGADTIDFDSSFSTPKQITLGGTQLELTDSATTTLSGPGASLLSVSGNNASRVLRVASGAQASISGLTIAGGRVSGSGAAGSGGGLANFGTTTLTDAIVSGNRSATLRGGGLYNNAGTLTLNNCTVSGSTSSSGGIFNRASGALVLNNSTVSDNSGRGVESESGTITLTNSTVSGISNILVFLRGGTATLTNTTISGGNVGFQLNGGNATLTNCTISSNILGLRVDTVGPLTIGNTIVNSGSNSVSGSVVSLGNNLIPIASDSFGWIGSDLTGTREQPLDALLSPLGNYGGPTQTLALLPGSPAIDAGSGGPTTDQRGVSRIGGVDIGAFESHGFNIAYVSGSGQSSSGAFSDPLVAEVTAVDPIEPVEGGRVTFTAPASGAAALFTDNRAVILGDGTASVFAASNFVGGSYTVAATTSGAAGSVAFDLTNYSLVSLEVTPGNPNLALGVSGQFYAIGTFSDASTHDLTDVATWSSASPSTAQISVYGVATGLSLGTSEITASFDGVTSPDDTLTVIAASFVVNTVNDDFGFYAGTTSLREAIASANLVPGATITFDASVFASPSTITLLLGELQLSNTTDALSIVAPAGGVGVNGNGWSRVFKIDPDVHASISGLTIMNGLSNGYGGGLLNFGTLTLTNCTIVGNSGWGGALATGTQYLPVGSSTLINCTVTGNSSGGLDARYGTTTLLNTIVAGGNGWADISGAVTGSNNLVGPYSGGLENGVDGNIVGVIDPLLSPVDIHGGTAPTAAALPGSPAIGGGTWGVGVPTTDQRGVSRGASVDIGAFQTSGFTLTIADGSTPQSADIGSMFANPLDVSVTANNPDDPVDGGLVEFVADRVGGATAILGSQRAVISGGWATTFAAPNNALGTYTVVASTTGAAPVSFELTNEGTVLTQLIVNTTSDDSIAGPGFMSLREAILFVNYDSIGLTSISFDETVFTSPMTIYLNGSSLHLTNNLAPITITGPSVGVTIDAAYGSRVFQIDAGVTASLSDFTLTGGWTEDVGGGLLNAGDATLTRVEVIGNYGFGGGGGVYNSGVLTLNSSRITQNNANSGEGGGLKNDGLAVLTDCTVSGNSSYGSGGGVKNSGLLFATGSAFNDNHTNAYGFNGYDGSGGGLYNTGTATLTGCTISGNSTSALARKAGGGGVGVGIDSMTTLNNCVISGNSALGRSASGGGVYIRSDGIFSPARGTVFLNGCDITDNSATRYGGGVANWGAVTISGGTISRNRSQGGGGLSVGEVFDNYNATASVTDCLISDNSAGNGSGGGVLNFGATTLTRCVISGNTATNGGGVRSAAAVNGYSPPASLTLTDCTLSGNAATGLGGAALSGGGSIASFGGGPAQAYYGLLTLTNCTVSGNSAGDRGGAVFTTGLGLTVVTNSTITGNSALNGGAFYSTGFYFTRDMFASTTLSNCTVSGNFSTGDGGGLVNGPLATSTLGNTILAGNTADGVSPDALGDVVSNGNNLVGQTDGSSGWVASDLTGTTASPLIALLAPLDDYGGLTKTMALLPGSPAIDAGSSDGAPDFDQRGLGRVGGVDIGAFESQGFTLTPVAGSTPQTTLVGTAFGNPLAVRITANNPVEPVNGGVIRFTPSAGAGASSSLSADLATVSDSEAAVTATANAFAGSSSVSATATGAPTPAVFGLTNQAAVATTSVGWGSVGTAELFTASDGLRLLPAGRKTDLPWINIQKITITLSAATTLTAANVSVTGITIADYGPVTVTGSGSTYVITLAKPIASADRVTVTISGPLISTFTRRLDVLPGDVSDDGVVDASDLALVRTAYLNQIANIFAQISGNGLSSLVDFNIVRSKANTRLPKIK